MDLVTESGLGLVLDSGSEMESEMEMDLESELAMVVANSAYHTYASKNSMFLQSMCIRLSLSSHP
jgi:hypothetical protein